jgi:predicted O-linked N-acetylglucosamine transferase (SPINDLY family)
MSKVRLVIVQGPNQLLYALSILRYQEKYEEYQDCEDILILGGYRADPKLTEICLQISQIWPFKNRTTLHGFHYFCLDNSLDFVSEVELLKRILNFQSVDVIYTVRNWQSINEIFLYAYPNAHKICYGELGWLDLSSSLWSNFYSSPPLNPSGNFIHVDEAYAILVPVDAENAFEQCQVRVIEPDFFKSVVYDSAKQIQGLSEYCARISEQLNNSITLILTSYDTEAGFIKSYQDEIECYLSCVLPNTQHGEAILVKGHPRQIFNQSQLLVERLREYGRSTFVVSEFTQVPIELFVPFLNIEKVIAPASSACISLAYLSSCELIIGFGEKLIRKYINSQHHEAILVGEYIRTLRSIKIRKQDFQTIHYLKLLKEFKSFRQNPISISVQTDIIDINNKLDGEIFNFHIKEFLEKNQFINRLCNLVDNYYRELSEPFIEENLRLLRKQMAEFWLSVEDHLLERVYLSKVGEAYQALLNSRIQNEPFTESEQNIVPDALAQVAKGFEEPQTLQYLLVAMLYYPPHQLPLVYDLTHIPSWLLHDYLKFTLLPPLYFQEIGDANSYYQYMEKWVNYLHNNIVNNPTRCQLWLDVASDFTNAANFIPLYFNRANLKGIYTKRADIMEFFLNQVEKNIDYEFPERSPERKKIRLGILAIHFGPQTETFAALPVYQYLNRDVFEIVLFTLTTSNHRLERYCAGHADALVQLPSELSSQVQAIREANLDILFISTNVTAVTHPVTLLALHRLARIQIVDANSPVSTGMRHIDYYISSKLSEPEEHAQQHYTESLITLNSPPQCFNFATEQQIFATITISRESLGIDENTVVYISGANYFKIIPEVEATWAKIIATVPNSVLLLYPFNPNWSSSYPFVAFHKRIVATFAQFGLGEDRLIILDPVPNRADIKEILKLADIYLDSYPYSGMTSLIDPLEVGLPTVAMEAEPSRSKKGASLLRELQLPDLIANSEEAYIQLAVTFGTNPELRQQKSNQLKQRMQANPIFLDTRSFCAQIEELFQELFLKHQALALKEKLNLRDMNLIIFPDWSQSEDILYQELASVITTLVHHPEKQQITLLMYVGHLSEDDINLFLSDVAMNLLLEEDLDVADGPEICLVGKLEQMQWKALLPRIQARIALERENHEAVAQIKAESVPVCNLDNFITSYS